MADPVLLERPAEGVALIRINRPEARNALNLEALAMRLVSEVVPDAEAAKRALEAKSS